MLAERVFETSFSLQPHVVATVVEDGAVLLDLETKYFFQLNEPAWAIVQLFEAGGASQEAIEETCRSWGATDADVPAVRALLSRLHEEYLVGSAESEDLVPAPFRGPWSTPTIERQAEPLHTLVTSAFDPSIPLAE
ncbi:MAG: PqqD family peptide modification chaperone [Vulcanimicrobiaceae bacterium]